MMRRIVPLFLILLLCAAGVHSGHPLRVMSWNVENLFDTVHDEGFRDEDFLPQGEYHWTSYRYWHKMTELAKVIAAVTEDGGIPDLIGLCEVENDSVLTTLCRRSLLRHMNYDYVMTRCEDARGIDVALLYQPARFRLLEHRSIRVPSREHGLHPTRDILYAKGLALAAEGLDTLHVLVAHLPSRAGGYEGDRNRRLAADVLWTTVDSILSSRKRTGREVPRVVLMGDFNADRHDRVFRRAPLRMTDDVKAQGTYCYQGLWQWIDHILVSSSLATDAPAHPVSYPWLLEENKTYDGQMPRRTYRGPTYHGGISDHLPIVLDLSL